MATCLAVIKRASRMLGSLAAGREPDAADAADGLEALQGLYLHLIASGTFGQLTDVIADADYEANENERVLNTSGGTITVTGPSTVEDDSAPDGVRPPRDGSLIVVSGATPTSHIYDAYLASWVDIEGLTLTATAPLAARLGTGLSALLAAHLAGEWGEAVPQTVALQAGQAMSALTHHADGVSTVTVAEFY